jgi:hypothetical protein
MSNKEAYAQLLSQAALGDEEAIQMLAANLDAINDVAVGAQSAVAQRQPLANSEWHGRVVGGKKAFPDVWNDPEGLKVAARKLAALRERNPDTTLEEAFEKVTDAVLAELGPGEERDYASAIADMRKVRTEGREDRAPVDPDDEPLMLPDAETAHLEMLNSLTIEEMKQARQPRANPYNQHLNIEEVRALKRAGRL